jgi:hypothetical protein
MIAWFKTMTANEYIQGIKSGSFFHKHIWQINYCIICKQQDYQDLALHGGKPFGIQSDYNLAHFATPGVMQNRLYEVRRW